MMKKALATILATLICAGFFTSCVSASNGAIVSPAPLENEYGERTDMVRENYALAREAAAEGVVLLENDGTLPLEKKDSVSLFGIGSKRLIKGGTGSGLVYTEYFASLIDGMRGAADAGLIALNDNLNSLYEEHYAAWLKQYADLTDIQREGKEITEIELSEAQVAEARALSNTAVYTISRVQGEGGDRSAVKGDYYISDIEAANLAKIDAAGFEKFIVVLNVGTAVDTSFIKDYPSIGAVVLAWLPGVEGGYAIADVLTGEVNPSGKLVDTFAKSYDDYPSAKTFSESNSYVNYYEDIYNGYRYFETFDPNGEKVNYGFGYGLSYTSFEISGDSVTQDGENISVSAEVTNTGDTAGKEVVQVYYSAPDGKLGKAAKELAGYAKTELLEPGASQTVSVSFPISDMASFDDLGKTGKKAAYVLEAGDYNIYIGNSIKNAGERGVKGTYTADELKVTRQLSSLLTPKSLSKRLTSDGSYERLAISSEEDGSIKLDLSSGAAILDAENYHNGSEGLECPVIPELDNLKYVSGLTSGKYISFDISFDSECEVGISLSLSNGGEKVDTPFKIYVNDSLIARTMEVPCTGTSGGSYVFKTFYYGLALFGKGKNTLKIESATDSVVDIDYIEFKSGASRPVISASETTVVEAESADVRFDNGDTALPISDESAFGEILVAKISKAGKYLEYDLFCEEEGVYEMLFAYAATRSYTTPLDIYVNGINQNVSYTMAKTSPDGTSASENPTAFYNTSAWMETPFRITIPKGFVTLRLLANGGCPNLNKFSLKKVFALPDGYALISDSESTVIEAESYTVANSDAEGLLQITKVSKKGEVVLDYLSSTAGGRYVEYQLYFKQAGEYSLTINCAASKNAVNPYTFYANGVLLPTESYTVLKTAPDGATAADDIYHTYKDTNTLPLTFPSGKVTFRVVCGAGQIPNLNRFTFTKTGASAESGTGASEAAAMSLESEQSSSDEMSDRVGTFSEGADETSADYAETTGAIISFLDVMNGEKTMDDFLAQLTNLDLIRLAGGHPPITGSSSSMGRLRKYYIPEVTTADGGAGIRINKEMGATCWPCSTMLACTWNLGLIERVGEGVGREAASIRLDCWLAPGMNIHRNPLCGRNFEYFSEDPLVTGNCASAITIGARKQGLHTVAKHFAVNNKEAGRNNSDSRISERALREIYLRGFEILVEKADPRYIMTSYNLINGVETAESHELCTDILRGEWGFNGLLMTDWFNNSDHVKELLAGNNIKKQTGDINGLFSALKKGTITRNDLKENARVILSTLTDSMSARIAGTYHTVDRESTVLIDGKEFNFVNDDQLGTVTKEYTKNGFHYKVGDYAEAGAWTPGLSFSCKEAIGVSVSTKTSSENISFDEPEYFLEYFTDVKESGNYKIELFCTAGNGANIYVDGEFVGESAVMPAVKDEKLKRSKAVYVYLSEGKHEIRVNSASGYIGIAKLMISAYYGDLPELIDCKTFSKCDSEWGLNYESLIGENGAYTHIVPDLSEEVYDRRTDHWSIGADESTYKYLAFCYRTNYDGKISVKAVQTSGNTAFDGTRYNFTADVCDKWTTTVVELNGEKVFNQMHFSPFGIDSKDVNANMYFDLLHYCFFKSREDAEKYCSSHAEKPVSGKVILEREPGVMYYDDLLNGYISSAEIVLSQGGKTVARTMEYESGITEVDGRSAVSFGFSVPDGEYTLTVRKPGYAEYVGSVTVEDGTAYVGNIILAAGDVTDSFERLYGDGIIDVNDFIRIIRAFSPNASKKFRMFTDIDEDGSITVFDLALLKASFANRK